MEMPSPCTAPWLIEIDRESVANPRRDRRSHGHTEGLDPAKGRQKGRTLHAIGVTTQGAFLP